MKFLIIALALFAVVSALPPGHGFGHRQHEDYQLEEPGYHQNKHHQLNLIKSIYNQLIESLNHPSQDENEEEERAINDIVDTIHAIGQIIDDNSNDGDDVKVDNGFSKPQHSEYYGLEVDALNKPSASDNEDFPNWQKEKKVLSIEDDVKEISPVDEFPVGDENKSSEVFVVDKVLRNDDKEPDVSFVNRKVKLENPIIAYKSLSVVNEVPTL